MSDAGSPVDTFLLEAEELLADMERTVLELETDPENEENINRLFRDVHTVKGSGSMFGFDDIVGFAHHLETVLDYVRKKYIMVDQHLIDLILLSKDYLKEILDLHGSEESPDAGVGQRLINEFSILLAPLKKKEKDDGEQILEDDDLFDDFFPDEEEDDREIEPVEHHYRIRFKPDPFIMQHGMEPLLLINELKDAGDCISTAHIGAIPPLSDINPELCYVHWDILLYTSQTTNDLRDIFIFVEEGSNIRIDELVREINPDSDDAIPRLGDILLDKGDVDPEVIKEMLTRQKRLGELLVESGAASSDSVVSALDEQRSIKTRKERAIATSVRVPSEKLDELINLVGELVIIQASITQVGRSAAEFREKRVDNLDDETDELLNEFTTPVETLERLTRELRDCALNIRMLPIGTVFSKYRRLVRDLGAELGKRVDLVTEGAETELDKTVIERLSDPLMHLIRNAVDHGIHSPQDRWAMGKPAKGTVKLAASHQGANVVISIEDDGVGLNLEKIRNKALEKGLISPDADLTKEEIFQLIFMPGLSTAGLVTNVSGRGVGMDVVRREINSMGGTISIASEKNEFTRFRLSLPLTLAIIDGLLVSVGGDFLVLPLSHVEECAELTKENLSRSGRRNMALIRGELIPFVRLRKLFEVESDPPKTEHIAVVRTDERLTGIIVDEIVGNIQAVIKSLDRTVRDTEGISGATIMGDGTVALIVDVPGLLRLAKREEEKKL